MYSYRTVDSKLGVPHVVLRDGHGRFHLARHLNEPPPVGMTLDGDKPHLGFGILFCPTTRRVFRVIFERINTPDVASLAAAA